MEFSFSYISYASCIFISIGLVYLLEKEMATGSSVLAWRILGTGEPGGLLSMGLHRVRHDWSDLAAAAAYRFSYSSISNLLEHLFQIFLFDFHVTLILSYLSWFLNKDLFLKLCVFCLSCLFIYLFWSYFLLFHFFLPL